MVQDGTNGFILCFVLVESTLSFESLISDFTSAIHTVLRG